MEHSKGVRLGQGTTGVAQLDIGLRNWMMGIFGRRVPMDLIFLVGFWARETAPDGELRDSIEWEKEKN